MGKTITVESHELVRKALRPEPCVTRDLQAPTKRQVYIAEGFLIEFPSCLSCMV
jgi:hypothetical protein